MADSVPDVAVDGTRGREEAHRPRVWAHPSSMQPGGCCASGGPSASILRVQRAVRLSVGEPRRGDIVDPRGRRRRGRLGNAMACGVRGARVTSVEAPSSRSPSGRRRCADEQVDDQFEQDLQKALALSMQAQGSSAPKVVVSASQATPPKTIRLGRATPQTSALDARTVDADGSVRRVLRCTSAHRSALFDASRLRGRYRETWRFRLGKRARCWLARFSGQR